MSLAFKQSKFIIKAQGLSLGGKYVVSSAENEALLYVEHKTRWKAPYQTYRVCSDEKRKEEVLVIQDANHEKYAEYYEVRAMPGGEIVGGVGVDWSHFFKDAWGILDATGAVVANVCERAAGRAILHELTDGLVPQVIDIEAGGQVLAELRQKAKLTGHQLHADFSADCTGRLDRRLGLAAAILIFAHQKESGSA